MKTEQQYVWVVQGRPQMCVTDLVTLYKNKDFDPTSDKIYELGPEVKVELTVKVTPVNPLTRSANIPKQDPLTRY
jgi:hypothetical protein